jgi:ferredoxin--NADP+ reductase
VGGGAGIAPVYPIARALFEAGNTVITIIGARCKDMLFWEEEMRQVSSEFYVATDDGTAGMKGFVTEVLKDVLAREKVDKVLAIGPVVMMQAVAKVVPENLPLTVSLNTIMVDGTGMCGACRLEADGETKFACVDGPEFDGHTVNWELVLQRSKMFLNEEAIALRSVMKGGCQCQSQNEK